MKTTASLAATALMLLGCRSSAPATDDRLLATPEVEVFASAPYRQGDKIRIDRLLIHSKTAKPITEVSLVVFDDANGDEQPDASEEIRRMAGRAKGSDDVSMGNLVFPFMPRLMATILVKAGDSRPVTRTWSLVVDEAR